MSNISTTVLPDVRIPSVLPVSVESGLTCLAIVIGALFTTMGGIGGGGLFIPTYTLVAGLPVEYAIPLSSLTIAASALVRAATFTSQRHPQFLDQSLVDYSAVAVFTVSSANFAFLGVLLSWWLPEIVNIVSVTLVIGVVFTLTTRKAVVMIAKNVRRRRQISPVTVNVHIDTGRGAVEMPDLEPGVSQSGAQDQPPACCQIFRDNAGYIGIITATFLVVAGFTLARLAYSRCQLPYYFLYLGQVALIAGWAVVVARYVLQTSREWRDLGRSTIPGNIVWNIGNLIKFAAVSAFTGALSSYIGIGSSMVLSPTMLTMGVSPEVTVSVATLTTLFASSIAAMQYGVSGQLLLDYSIAGAICGAIGGFIGSRLSISVIKRYKKTYLIVSFLAAALLVSLILLIVNSISRIRSSDFKLQHFCT